MIFYFLGLFSLRDLLPLGAIRDLLLFGSFRFLGTFGFFSYCRQLGLKGLQSCFLFEISEQTWLLEVSKVLAKMGRSWQSV